MLPATALVGPLVLARSQDLATPASGMQGSIITTAEMMLPDVCTVEVTWTLPEQYKRPCRGADAISGFVMDAGREELPIFRGSRHEFTSPSSDTHFLSFKSMGPSAQSL